MKRLGFWYVFSLLTLACQPNPPRSEDSPQPPEESALRVPGKTTSRYKDSSPVFQVLERVKALSANTLHVEGLQFTWGEPYLHAEGAIAMSATRVGEQFFNAEGIHRLFCRGHGIRRPCTPEQYLQPANDLDVIIKPKPIISEKRNIEDVLSVCTPEVLNQIIAWAKRTVEVGDGAVLSVYVKDAFPDTETEDATNDVHLFVLYGVEGTNALLLRDAADDVPVTYRLKKDRFCTALSAPLDAHWGTDYRGSGTRYGLIPWVVTTSERLVTNTPFPRPAPRKPRGETDRVLTKTDQPKQPPVTVLGHPGTDPFDLGDVPIPVDWARVIPRRFRLASNKPKHLTLGLGVSPSRKAQDVSQIEVIERRWGVRAIGRDRFLVTRPTKPKANTPLEEAYAEGLNSSLDELKGLTARYVAAQKVLHKDRAWALGAALSFVQSIPYELIEENTLGLRGPLAVLHDHAGDCDSKSLLGAALAHLLGYPIALAINNKEQHAVLGIVIENHKGTFLMHKNVRYTLIEMTTPRPIGEVGIPIQMPHGADASRYGWRLIPLTPI